MSKKDTIHIELTDKSSKKIKEFEKIKWAVADQEHYGKPVDFTKNKYKFVAKNEDGEITGILDLMTEANLAFVEGLLIGSKFRKQGIGSKLMKQAEDFAKKNKCTKVYLETNEDWEAVEFYKKLGYEVTGKHEDHALGQRSLIFTKFL